MKEWEQIRNVLFYVLSLYLQSISTLEISTVSTNPYFHNSTLYT